MYTVTYLIYLTKSCELRTIKENSDTESKSTQNKKIQEKNVKSQIIIIQKITLQLESDCLTYML